ncbi:hypothetical protein DLJ53_33975 [Acuticoccus sediminis]|uniref:Uncharacterized protein n=1 Tax=Acuticoccus sediminis TaxID=2184697 RepID=A0A8B2NEQ1_9HYPH|nr:hypothetical protein DLJ53_33975 [Acuticoccus sediminis]
MLAQDSPETAKALEHAAATIAAGQTLSEQSEGTQAKHTSDIRGKLAEARVDIHARFAMLDEQLADVPDGAERVRLMRQIAALKAEAAPHMRGSELRDFQRSEAPGRYEGIAATDAASTALKANADEAVRQIAERYDVNGEATVERYSGGRPSKALAAQYGEAEARERRHTRRRRGALRETPERCQGALRRMHEEIAAIYRDAWGKARTGVAAEAEPPRLPQPLRGGCNKGSAADRLEKVSTRKAEAEQQGQERVKQEWKNAERKTRERGGRGL